MFPTTFFTSIIARIGLAVIVVAIVAGVVLSRSNVFYHPVYGLVVIHKWFSFYKPPRNRRKDLHQQRTVYDANLKNRVVIIHATLAEARPIESKLVQYLPTIVTVFNKGAKSVIWVAEQGNRTDGLVVGGYSWYEVTRAFSKLSMRPVHVLVEPREKKDQNFAADKLKRLLRDRGTIILVDQATASHLPLSQVGDAYIRDSFLPDELSLDLKDLPQYSGLSLVQQSIVAEKLESTGR